MLAKILNLRFDLIFFYLFVFFLPLEKKHVFVRSALDSSAYNPWLSIELYLTDIIFALVLLFFALRIFQRGNHFLKTSFHKKTLSLVVVFFVVVLIPFLLRGLGGLEIFHLTKLLEYLLLFLYAMLNVDTIVKLLSVMIIFIISSLFQAVLGIWQFTVQHSLGLKILGEPDLAPLLENVAKIVVEGEKMIRAYGSLSHANILGAYLFTGLVFIVGLACFSLLLLAKKRENGVSRETVFEKQSRIMTILLSLAFYLLFLGLVLSFSRSSWLAFLMALVFLAWFSRKFWPGLKLFIGKNRLFIAILFILILATIIYFLPQIKAKTSQFDQFGDQARTGRIFYTEIAFAMIKKHPFLGLGYGNFVAKMANFSQKSLAGWEFQPVHNVFLLSLAETGLLGFLAFCGFLIYFLRQKAQIFLEGKILSSKALFISLFAVLFGFFPILLFDHYFWSIQQGALLFWLILGLVASVSGEARERKK